MLVIFNFILVLVQYEHLVRFHNVLAYELTLTLTFIMYLSNSVPIKFINLLILNVFRRTSYLAHKKLQRQKTRDRENVCKKNIELNFNKI